MLFLKIFAAVLVVAGFVVILLAKKVVTRFGLDKRVKIADDMELSDEDLAEYKQLKATVTVKMLGMLVVLPGLIMTLIAFK